MSTDTQGTDGRAALRIDYVPVSDYLSPETARLERDRLWLKTWQIACREEEVANRGNYVTYDIIDQSVFVVRAPNGIKAFHNVCPHRGRQLTTGCGAMTKVHCPFHGWQWTLDGKIARVPDREDWDGYPDMEDAALHLRPVRVASWGGWVWINFDPDGESFESHIEPLPHYLDCIELEKMRYSWRKRIPLKANWKVAIEAFMESYHVMTTHPQTLPIIDPANFSSTHGKHGRHAYYWTNPLGTPSPKSGLKPAADVRATAAGLADFMIEELSDVRVSGAHDNQLSGRATASLRRHLLDTPADVPVQELPIYSAKYMAEAAIADGAGWPQLTLEQMMELGADWSFFPNFAIVHSLDATLYFWARPNGQDHASCILEMGCIVRFAPGDAPQVTVEMLADWPADIDRVPHLLSQDLSNIEAVYRGIQSVAIQGVRINPKQETQISHFHQVLRGYVEG